LATKHHICNVFGEQEIGGYKIYGPLAVFAWSQGKGNRQATTP
jgi:hypothetical protein